MRQPELLRRRRVGGYFLELHDLRYGFALSSRQVTSETALLIGNPCGVTEE